MLVSRSALCFWLLVVSHLLPTYGAAKLRYIGGNLGAREFFFDPYKPEEYVETTIAGATGEEEGILLSMVAEVAGSPAIENELCEKLFSEIDRYIKGERPGMGVTRNHLGDGCQSGGPFDLKAEVDGETLSLVYTAHDYLMQFHTTTPSGISGSDDPRFLLSHDLQLTIELRVPQDLKALADKSQILKVQKAEIQLTNASLKLARGDSGTLFKWLVDGFAGAVAAQANARINGELSRHGHDMTERVQTLLVPRNKMLQEAMFIKRYDTMSARVLPNDIVGVTRGTVLFILGRSEAAVPNGPGRIEGVVIWNRADGEFVDGHSCDALRVLIFTQAKMFKAGDFTFKEAPAGSLTAMEEISGLSADKVGCEFEVRNLPLDLPMRPEVLAKYAGAWQSPSVGLEEFSTIYGVPVSYTGRITIDSQQTAPEISRGRRGTGRRIIEVPGQRRIEMTLHFNRKPR